MAGSAGTAEAAVAAVPAVAGRAGNFRGSATSGAVIANLDVIPGSPLGRAPPEWRGAAHRSDLFPR